MTSPLLPPDAQPSSETMGARLIRSGRLTAEQVQQIVARQHTDNLRFGEAAVRLGLLSETDVQTILSDQFNYANTLSTGLSTFSHLAIARAPFDREAEAIRQIRAGITAQIPAGTAYSLAVVSPGQGEGKSYLAASLAIAFSQAGHRTLLINANLRTSGQSGLLSAPAPGQPGLSSILAGRIAPQPGASVPHFPLLKLLDAGPLPPNPTELLLEPALRKLMTGFAGQFDLFIVDTPASSQYSDAQIIARQTDACVLVARRDVTSLEALRSMYQSLGQAGVRIVGTVYNDLVPVKPRKDKSRERKRA